MLSGEALVHAQQNTRSCAVSKKKRKKKKSYKILEIATEL